MQIGERNLRWDSTLPLGGRAETPEVLYFKYYAYRRRHVDRLLRLVPRGSIRDLYGEARDWAKARGLHDARDPMATLTRFAEHLLPLPTFEVWLADCRRHPLRHIEDCGQAEQSPVPVHPVKVEERRFHHRGRTWIASLHVFVDDRRWRGFLRFRERGHARRHHTAHIFLEETARDVRRSFREFDEAALGAFLRSVLP